VLSDWPGLSIKAGELVLSRLRRGRTKAEGVEGLDGGSFFVSTCSGLFAIAKEKKSQIKKSTTEKGMAVYLVFFVAEGASGAVVLSNGSAMPSLASTSIRASPEEKAVRVRLFVFWPFFFCYDSVYNSKPIKIKLFGCWNVGAAYQSNLCIYTLSHVHLVKAYISYGVGPHFYQTIVVISK